MRNHHSNIDPFNAGEPVLPWCDPETYDDQSDVFDDGQREKRQKLDGSSSKDSSSKDSSSKDSSSKKAKGPSRKHTAKSLSKKSPSKKAKKHADHLDENQDKPASTGGKAGKRGKNTFWVVAMIILLLSGILPLLASIPGCIAGTLNSVFITFDGDSPFDSDSPSAEAPSEDASSPEEFNEAQTACLDAAISRMELIETPDSPERKQVVQLIVDDFNQECEDYFSYSADELGLDGTAVATWLIDSMEYEISSVHAFPNDPSPYGSVYLNITLADPLSLYGSFFSPASDYLVDQGLMGYSDEPGPDDAVRAHLGEMLQSAIESPTEPSEPFARFELSYSDGTWSINETDYLAELEFIFGM